MFKLFSVILLAGVFLVEPRYWKGGSNSYYGWKKKPVLQKYPYSYAKEPQSDWFHNMGDDWEFSKRLASFNPYYGWYKNAAKQMDVYGPAKHVGLINRGRFFNPELNYPTDRAFGYQSDFNLGELNSGAFKYKPRGQKIRAKAVHVNGGLASFVGEVVTLPPGQHVQEDGTILLQTPHKGDPCNPNPCTSVRMPTCTVVNQFTAKCSRSEDYKLALTWFNPLDEDDEDNDLDLYLVPALHDGSDCGFSESYDYLAYFINYMYDDDQCGVIFSGNDFADYDTENIAVEHATFTTVDDGTKYQDYTYAVIADRAGSEYNLSEGGPTLTVEYGGMVKQTLAVPQYRPGGANLNFDAENGRAYYFFGCFRPQYGYVDTRGAGFYDYDTPVFAGLDIWDVGLCKALLGWTDGTGFNPHEQSGSGDETYISG